MKFKGSVSVVVFGIFALGPLAASEGEGLLDSFAENMRLAIDTSSRVVSGNPTNDLGYMNWVGIDLHSVVAGPFGDIATTTLQGYLTRIDDLEKRPGFFDDEDDWEFVYRIFRFDFKPFGSIASPRIRIGHIETPFGLEHTINTNGTLRGYSNPRNLGLLADWGIGLVGTSSKYIYETLVSRGSGQDYHSRGNPWAFTARIGTDPGGIVAQGVSVYSGHVGGVDRWRVAYDNRLYYGAVSILSELSAGENDAYEAFSGLLEIDWNDRGESLLGYMQFKYFGMGSLNGWGYDLATSIGARYSPDSHWATSIQYTKMIQKSNGPMNEPELSLQLRYRY